MIGNSEPIDPSDSRAQKPVQQLAMVVVPPVGTHYYASKLYISKDDI